MSGVTAMAARVARPALAACVAFTALSLAACGSDSAAILAPPPPRLVTAKAAGGSPGTGPRVVASPTPLPGGKPGSQQVALSDRTLVIKSVTKRAAKKHDSVIIALDVAVHDTGAKAISNEFGFYELVGSSGDTFSVTSGDAGSFDGAVGSQGSRGGLIEFQLPAAAVAGLYLLYRPGNGADTVLTPLQTS